MPGRLIAGATSLELLPPRAPWEAAGEVEGPWPDDAAVLAETV